MLALAREEVRRLVPMPDAIALMKAAFAELSAGRTDSPLRTVIPIPAAAGDALFMPAHVPAMDALGLKVVSVFKNNPARDLPVIHALVCLLDGETGQPLAIMDGTYLTALRTGAASGAATDLLARPDSRVLAAIGAGAQGATQIAAVCAVRPIERVVAVDLDEGVLARLRANLARDWPEELERYERLYAGRAYLGKDEHGPVRKQVAELAKEYGIADRGVQKAEPPPQEEEPAQLALAV